MAVNFEHLAETQTFVPSERSLRRSIASAVDAGIKRSRPVRWLRLCCRAPITDPWDLLDLAAESEEFLVAWSDAGGRRCLVGLGTAASWSLAGEQSWRLAETRLDELRAGTADLDGTGAAWGHRTFDTAPGDSCGDGGAPLAVVGFAFDSAPSPQQSPWRDWPAARVVVPAATIWRKADDDAALCRVTLTLPVGERDHTARLARELISRWERVQRMASAATLRAAANDQGCPAALPLELLEDEQHWRKRVESARAAIHRGDLSKVVLARGAELHLPGGFRFDLGATLRRLRVAHPQSVVFAVVPGGEQAFLGATPERLLTLSGRRVDTHAVAGTIARGLDAASDAALGRALLASGKDRGEHAMVVEHLRSRLVSECRAVEVEREPRLITLPRVQHLETRVSGFLRQATSALSLGSQLHPTPAVGGWPVDPAMAWLRKNEPTERGWYAGVIGIVAADGDATLAVAIRSALLSRSTARLYAGAGIVAPSDAAAEWRETELKLATMREALALAECEGGARRGLGASAPGGREKAPRRS